MATHNVWTDELCDKLKKFWGAHSATEITMIFAEQNNVIFTRNAIVGKLHRMGLSMDDKTGVHPSTTVAQGRRAKIKRAVSATPVSVQAINRARDLVLLASSPIAEAAPGEIESLNVSFDDLKRGDCRWPTAPDGHSWFFCGHATERGPYCQHHSAVAFLPKPKKGFVPSKYADSERPSYRLGGGRAA